MKKLLFILFTISQIFGYYCFAQQYGWHLLDHAIIPDEPNFSDVFFINADLGWFAIKGPFNLKQIYRTVDGGATFSSQNTPFTTLAIQMLNSDVGYAVGFSADVLKTTNGGSDWMIMGSASNMILFSIYLFLPSQIHIILLNISAGICPSTKLIQL